MKRYRLDNIGFKGTSKDLVTQLHKASRAQCRSDEDWMRETASRLELTNGTVLRSDRTDNFVDDLIRLDLIPTLLEK